MTLLLAMALSALMWLLTYWTIGAIRIRDDKGAAMHITATLTSLAVLIDIIT